MSKHILTESERHDFTAEDKSNRKGKTFGENNATKKAIKELQPRAYFLTKEEWKKEMQKEGMSYFKISKYAELLTFAKYSKQTQQTTQVNETQMLLGLVKRLEKRIGELEDRLDVLESTEIEKTVEEAEEDVLPTILDDERKNVLENTGDYIPRKMDPKRKAELLKRLAETRNDPYVVYAVKTQEKIRKDLQQEDLEIL